MVLGFFLIRPIPLLDESHSVWDNYEARNSSRTRLLDPSYIEGQNSHHNYTVPNGDTAVCRTENVSEHPEPSKLSAVTDVALLRDLEDRNVLGSGDFWLLATIVALRMCFLLFG